MKAFRIYLVCLFLLSVQFVSFSQVVTEQNTLEVSTTSLRKTNRQFKKSLGRVEKRYKKKLAKLYPNVPKESLDSLIKEEIRLKKEVYKAEVKDSAMRYIKNLKEKLTNALKETPEKLPIAKEMQESIRQLERLEEIQTLLKNPKQLESALDIKELKGVTKSADALKLSLSDYKNHFKDWDQKLLDQMSNFPQASLIKEQLSKAKSFKPLPETFQKPELFQSNDFVKGKLQEKAEEFKKAGIASLQEKLDAAQSKVTEIKKKFPSLESIEKNGDKTYNPYQGQPFLKRVVLRGNLQIVRQRPLAMNAALTLAYPLSIKSIMGVSVAKQIALEKPQLNQVQESQVSIRVFVRQNIWREVYIQGNYEFDRLSVPRVNEDGRTKHWLQRALIGIGVPVNLTPKIKLSITALYDLYYDAKTSLNNQPWVFRIGFGLGKK